MEYVNNCWMHVIRWCCVYKGLSVLYDSMYVNYSCYYLSMIDLIQYVVRILYFCLKLSFENHILQKLNAIEICELFSERLYKKHSLFAWK